jgi:hypothetical protein
VGNENLFGHRCDQGHWEPEPFGPDAKAHLDVGAAEPFDAGVHVLNFRAALAVWVDTAMSFFLGAVGLIFCTVQFFNGYAVPVILGGIAGSFFGVAGFGGAVSGAIPSSIAGAVIAMALKR